MNCIDPFRSRVFVCRHSSMSSSSITGRRPDTTVRRADNVDVLVQVDGYNQAVSIVEDRALCGDFGLAPEVKKS